MSEKEKKHMRELPIWVLVALVIYVFYLWTDKTNTAENMNDLGPAALFILYGAAALLRIIVLFVHAWF